MATETTKTKTTESEKRATSPIAVKVNDEERERLHALAEHYGLTVSGVIKMLVTRDARAVGIEPAKGSAR